MGQETWCEKNVRFAGEQWEPVERWIQDWEVPQGWNPRFADEGVKANHKLMNPLNAGLDLVENSICLQLFHMLWRQMPRRKSTGYKKT